MDIIDQAAAREQLDRDLALAAHRANTGGGASASHCCDCGDEIPPERQAAVRGVQTCICCQSQRETNHPRSPSFAAPRGGARLPWGGPAEGEHERKRQ